MLAARMQELPCGVGGHLGCSTMDADAWGSSHQGSGHSQGVAEVCGPPLLTHSQFLPLQLGGSLSW